MKNRNTSKERKLHFSFHLIDRVLPRDTIKNCQHCVFTAGFSKRFCSRAFGFGVCLSDKENDLKSEQQISKQDIGSIKARTLNMAVTWCRFVINPPYFLLAGLYQITYSLNSKLLQKLNFQKGNILIIFPRSNGWLLSF